MDQFYLNLDHFDKNLLLAINRFAPLKLLINPKDVYYDSVNAKHHLFELEDKVVHYFHGHLFVKDTSFKLNPSVAVINYLRTVDKHGQFNIADSSRNYDPFNKILPPVKFSQFRLLSEYNGIPHSFQLMFFGKFPLIEDGSFMDGGASYWKIDEKRII